MKRALASAGLALAVLTGMLISLAPAHAAPNCVAQSIASEHETYGTAWGAELIAYLASHPEALQEFGFGSLGDLVAYSAAQDPANCPPDL